MEVEPAGPLAQRADDIVAVMRGDLPYDSVFNAPFRAQVSEGQFRGIADQLQTQLGGLIGIESVAPSSATSGQIRIRFERGIASANLVTQAEPPFLVSGLLLTGVEPINDSPAALLEDIAALPGDTSILVTRLGSDAPPMAHNADTPLALGSTFKLYVLSALAEAVERGELRWEDTVPLSARSYPSGMMQDWPAGAPVTLHTLATLMISISDNTATDQLIDVLGREAIEAEIAATGHSDPSLTRPLLTTRDLFVLKSGPDFDSAAFLAMGEADRRAALEALAAVERDQAAIMAAFSSGPNAIDVEWFASGEDIAQLFSRMISRADPTALDIMAVSPALPEAVVADWDYVGFKGGSEPGVLNLSWLLRNAEGNWHVVTLGWNNPAENVDEAALRLMAARAVALIR